MVPVVAVFAFITIGALASAIGGDDDANRDTQASRDDEPARDERSEAPVARVTVPDVKGMDLGAAEAAVRAVGLVVGDVSGDTEGAVVRNQFPAPGTRADEGSAVDLTLALPEPDGTRQHPFPAGTVLAGISGSGVEEISVVLGAANWDAGAVVAAENRFNDPPPAGSVHVLLPVTITNLASEDAVVPWLAVDIVYVAPDGRSFDKEFEVIPNDLTDVGDLFVGGVGSGNILFTVPVDALGGLWAVSYGWSDSVFVVAN